jgi:hypothetical protein
MPSSRLARTSLAHGSALAAGAVATLTGACASGRASAWPGAAPDATARAASAASIAKAPGAESITDCVIGASSVRFRRSLTLRAPSGEPFGWLVDATDARLTTTLSGRFEATADGVRLRVTPRPFELPLYTRRPLTFGGLVHVGANTELGWVAGQPGATLTMRLPVDDRVEWLGASPLALAACTDLALAPQGLPQRWTTTDAARLRSLDLSKPVAIAATPGGRPIARLSATFAIQDVLLQREEGEFARIDWALRDGALAFAHVIGWVPRALLGEPRRGRTPRVIACGGGSVTAPDTLACKRDQPLFVQTSLGFEPVGTLLAGTRVHVPSAMHDWVAVEVQGRGHLALDEDATFVMRARDLEGCR